MLHLRKFSYRLDGDNIRFGLNKDLGFDEKSRNENIRRIGEVFRSVVRNFVPSSDSNRNYPRLRNCSRTLPQSRSPLSSPRISPIVHSFESCTKRRLWVSSRSSLMPHWGLLKGETPKVCTKRLGPGRSKVRFLTR